MEESESCTGATGPRLNTDLKIVTVRANMGEHIKADHDGCVVFAKVGHIVHVSIWGIYSDIAQNSIPLTISESLPKAIFPASTIMHTGSNDNDNVGLAWIDVGSRDINWHCSKPNVECFGSFVYICE